MIGQTISHYRVLEQIGAGGMGTVFRAEDTRLHRQVALKCLAPDISRDPAALARLRREAKAVSSLSHPNICTLFDVIDEGDRVCLIFELVDGRPLSEAIRRRPLSPDRAVAIATQLADALDTAHARGVIHRDIKPANVILTPRGDVKLLDFGVAVLSADAAEASLTRTRLTTVGGAVGTLGYMAPEQLRGAPADPRSDVFALGALLHEALTGQAAFGGDTEANVIDAVLHRTPASPSAINPTVPPELSRIAIKALDKDPGLRYQSARDLLADLRRLTLRADHPADNGPVRSSRRLQLGMVLATIAILAAIGLTRWTDRGGSTTDSAERPTADAPARLVVLPFENQTRNSEDDWLAGAFADSVSAGLQRVESLIMVPRERVVEIYASESRRASATLSTDLARELSRRLRVRYYVHGSYQKVGDQVRVVARLVDVTEDAIRAQDTLTGAFADVLRLEETLASRLASQFVPTGRGLSGPGVGTTNLLAYQRVTDARASYAIGRFGEARALLAEATTLDPRYAMAWALLSKSESRLVSPALASSKPSDVSLNRAFDHARQAIALDATLAESHIALALAYRSVFDRSRMRDAALRAIALDDRNGEPRVILGDALSASPGLGCPADFDPQAAEVAFLDALRVDPINASGYLNLATNRWWWGRRVEALEAIDSGLAVQPQNPLMLNSRPFNLLFAGRVDEAAGVLDERRQQGRTFSALETVTAGYLALARRRFDEASALFAREDVVRMMGNPALRLITATAYFEAGRSKDGARLLADAVGADRNCARWAETVPALGPYRKSPEFVAAVRAATR